MYILKRLALGIPAIILISSFIFFLSKLMPGTSGAYLLEDSMEMGYQVNKEARERIYQEYLTRTGQDKPLFYFSVASVAEPDTLHLIFPESHRILLKSLSFNFGNWPFISDYYKALVNLQSVAENSMPVENNLSLLTQLSKYYALTSEREIDNLLLETSYILAAKGAGEEIQVAFRHLKSRYAKMKMHQESYKRFIPVLQWHGSDNQYHHWLFNFFQGDMGSSLRSQRPVADIIIEALGITLLMTLTSLTFGWLIALFLAIVINLPVARKLEGTVLNGLYLLDTLPLFLLAFLLLVLLSESGFSVYLPSFGLGGYQLIDNLFLRYLALLRHLLLPIFCMTLVTLPYLTGQIDRALKEVSRAEYVTTARAKGLSDFMVLTKHTLRNAWPPLITVLTENLPALISGALVVEVIFAIPGMGRLLADAVSGRDYPVVLGIVVIVATVKIVANILADILYRFADPRIKIRE